MLGDDEIILLAMVCVGWLGAIVTFLLRRRWSKWVAAVALLLTIVLLVVLRLGVGHRG